jgi:hypothetical protein
VSDAAQKLRDKAAHARSFAASVSDARTTDALEAFGNECELKAAQLERAAGDDTRATQARRMRQKAEELRTAAEQMENPIARQSFMRTAESYDRLAEGFEWQPQNEKIRKDEVG